jgi:hypothetical protein
MDAVLRWIEEDVQEKTESLLQRKQDFQSFVCTLEQDGTRPKIEYFHGAQGITQAYEKLLETSSKELLQFLPIESKEEEDPLCKMRVELSRTRRRLGVGLRTITHDTHLGKRFQSRDSFCSRQTKLMQEERCPIPFEKIICGDIVACFHHAEERACFIYFPELASGERAMFEGFWKEERGESNISVSLQETKKPESLIDNVRLLGTRGGFLSLCGVVLFALIATYGMYMYTFEIMKDEIGTRLMSIAATAAPGIDVEDLENLRVARDMKTEEYQRVFEKLNDIRDRNVDIMYVYIMKPVENSDGMFVFLADADSNYYLPDPSDPDPIDVVPPGTYYDSRLFGEKYGALVMKEPVAEEDFMQDPWGTLLIAAAPIVDSYNKPYAFLGIDMDVSTFKEAHNAKFKPVFWFFIIISIFCMLKICAVLITSSSRLISPAKTKST